MDLRIIKDWNFAVGILIATAYGAILYGTLLILPLFLEDLMNYSASQQRAHDQPEGDRRNDIGRNRGQDR